MVEKFQGVIAGYAEDLCDTEFSEAVKQVGADGIDGFNLGGGHEDDGTLW